MVLVKVEVVGRSGTLKDPENFLCLDRFGSDRFCTGGVGFSGIRDCEADFFIPSPVSTLGFTFLRSGFNFLVSSDLLGGLVVEPPLSLADE